MKRAKYGYVWVTLALFLVSVTGHWAFGWWAYRDESRAGSRRELTIT
jgi:hypothetical protein